MKKIKTNMRNIFLVAVVLIALLFILNVNNLNLIKLTSGGTAEITTQAHVEGHKEGDNRCGPEKTSPSGHKYKCCCDDTRREIMIEGKGSLCREYYKGTVCNWKYGINGPKWCGKGK